MINQLSGVAGFTIYHDGLFSVNDATPVPFVGEKSRRR
jgi:hypothetical protein